VLVEYAVRMTVDEPRPEDKWRNRIESTGIQAQIDDTLEVSRTVRPLPPSEQADLERIQGILELVQVRLAIADPIVVNEPQLTAIVTAVASINGLLRSLAQSESLPNLYQAYGHAESALANLPFVIVPSSVDEAAKSLTSFKQSIAGTKSQIVRQLGEANAELVAKFESTETELESLKAQVASLAAEAESDAASRDTQFTESQDERAGSFEAQKQLIETEWTSYADEVKTAVNQQLANAEEANLRIDTILGLVGEKGLIGGYSRIADRERRAGFWWRVSAVLLALTAAGVSIYGIASTTGVDDWWREFLPKLTLTLVVGGVAAYTASLAGNHRNAQQEAERVGLQLAAAKPYLNDLGSDEMKDLVLALIATEAFKRGDARPSSESSLGPTLGAQLSELLRALISQAASKSK
jgi:hypothetical protein